MVVLVATCLSRLGLSCLGRGLQLLHQWRAGVELADRRRPRQVLDHFNLYCKCFPPNVTSQGRGGGGGGKRKVDARGRSGKKEMSGSREHKRKEKRKSERNTVAKDASIVIQSQLTMWSQSQQQLWARKGEECCKTGKEVRLVSQKVGLGSDRQKLHMGFKFDLDWWKNRVCWKR